MHRTDKMQQSLRQYHLGSQIFAVKRRAMLWALCLRILAYEKGAAAYTHMCIRFIMHTRTNLTEDLGDIERCEKCVRRYMKKGYNSLRPPKTWSRYKTYTVTEAVHFCGCHGQPTRHQEEVAPIPRWWNATKLERRKEAYEHSITPLVFIQIHYTYF
jgi:hypothetical protein